MASINSLSVLGNTYLLTSASNAADFSPILQGSADYCFTAKSATSLANTGIKVENVNYSTSALTAGTAGTASYAAHTLNYSNHTDFTSKFFSGASAYSADKVTYALSSNNVKSATKTSTVNTANTANYATNVLASAFTKYSFTELDPTIKDGSDYSLSAYSAWPCSVKSIYNSYKNFTDNPGRDAHYAILIKKSDISTAFVPNTWSGDTSSRISGTVNYATHALRSYTVDISGNSKTKTNVSGVVNMFKDDTNMMRRNFYLRDSEITQTTASGHYIPISYLKQYNVYKIFACNNTSTGTNGSALFRNDTGSTLNIYRSGDPYSTYGNSGTLAANAWLQEPIGKGTNVTSGSRIIQLGTLVIYRNGQNLILFREVQLK